MPYNRHFFPPEQPSLDRSPHREELVIANGEDSASKAGWKG
jgi:hypothetical protein